MKKQLRIPQEFGSALQEVINIISSTLNINTLRRLSVNAVASPVIQILIGMDKQGAIIKPLIYDGDAETPSSFIKLMMQDQVGSHLFELALKVCLFS